MQVALKKHAVERYQQRVKPALSMEAAKRELEQLCVMAELADEAPCYCNDDERDERTDAYLEIAPGIALAVVFDEDGEAHALTCIANWSLSDETRRRRNAAKARMRRSRTRHRRKYHEAGRPVRHEAA